MTTRSDLIQNIQDERQSILISYLTSDRPKPLASQISTDVMSLFEKHLSSISPTGKIPRIDLMIYSLGGDVMVPWRLVSLIREYCESFGVIVPYRAHSAATMICLGADEILMSSLSELTPIDPSTWNLFNPLADTTGTERIPISVEDVNAYFDFAKTKLGISRDEDLSKIFGKLVEANPQIHPLALGSVYRKHNLIRLLGDRLLKSHVNPMNDNEIEKIIEFFTEKLYSHDYTIGRKEAVNNLGLATVVNLSSSLAKSVNDLYEAYKVDMGLGKGWSPSQEIGLTATTITKRYKIALIESQSMLDYYENEVDITRVHSPGTPASQDQFSWSMRENG